MIGLLKYFFPSRYRVIPHEDGTGQKLEQFALLGGSDTRHAVFLQRFLEPEQREYFHCHRHRLMISIPFALFSEVRRLPTGERRFIAHYPLVPYIMTEATVHRVDTWFFGFTVFIQLCNKREWGYIHHQTGKYTSYSKMLKHEVKSL